MKSSWNGFGFMDRSLLVVGSFLSLVVLLASTGCGPKAFTKGEYDDPSRVALLDDKFNESDMQQLSETIVKGMVECPVVGKAAKAPVVIVERVQNRTQEHVDMTLLTDKIRTEMIRSGKFRFVNKEERKTLEDEVAYHENGNVRQETAKKKGRQVGADYILSGNLGTNIQEVGNDKLIYYKLTVNLTDLEASTIDCVADREIRKKYRKRSVGL